MAPPLLGISKEVKKADFDDFIRGLNEQYNLAINVVGDNLSPNKRARQAHGVDREGPCPSKLRSRLHYHFHNNSGDLQRILVEFARLAGKISLQWVRKSPTDGDSLPEHRGLPCATSEGEREHLHSALFRLTEQIKPRSPLAATSRSFPGYREGRRQAASARLGTSKRTSDEYQDELSSKRIRASQHTTNGESRELNHVPIRTRAATSNLHSTLIAGLDPTPESLFFQRQTSSIGLSDSALNESRVTITTNLFSQREDEASTQNTETTVEFEPQERCRDSFDDDSSLTTQPDPLSTSIKGAKTRFPRFLGGDVSECPTLSDQESERASSTSAKSFVQHFAAVKEHAAPTALRGPTSAEALYLEDRLKQVWPSLPSFLNNVPWAICWEVTRIALSCGVKLDELDKPGIGREKLDYSETWREQAGLREALERHPAFIGKTMPSPCDRETWKAALTSFRSSKDRILSLVVVLEWNLASCGPLFRVTLRPFKFERPHRLDRRFGSDRFLEILFPSLTEKARQSSVKNADANGKIVKWLTGERHFIAGRQWASFFVRKSSKTVAISDQTTNERNRKKSVTCRFERVYCFAENGHSFTRNIGQSTRPDASTVNERVVTRIADMLEWAISPSRNQCQPSLKLFQRIQLGLSRANATVVLEPSQIRNEPEDIRSGAGNIMNDGIGRMSGGLARKVVDMIGLPHDPSGFQARLGCAKGFWVVDGTERSKHEIWITTSPSQRKWECGDTDEELRTFEVKAAPRELRPANINQQFIVVLMARARIADAMKQAIATFLTQALEDEIKQQEDAVNDPVMTRQWVCENSALDCRGDRKPDQGIEFLGGLPNKASDEINFLLDGGFHPQRLQFLREKIYELAFKKCNLLKEKFNIKIPRSTYAFMVVDDVERVLQAGEVHLGFAPSFQAGKTPQTLLHGQDVLVARAPTHFPSDIQRVKAVFRPELAHLTNVIVFSTLGHNSLADKLSGGDYDGDMAWVCWEPDIVNNFENAEVPPSSSELFEQGYLRQEKQTFGEILKNAEDDKDSAVSDFIRKGFAFNMQEQLLGVCTNFKEHACYASGRIDDDRSILLSRLLAHLTDQAKQGIIFTQEDWVRLRKEQLGGLFTPEKPAYKGGQRRPTSHILDYLKFEVAEPTIEKQLARLNTSLGAESQDWDAELAEPYMEFEKQIAEASSAESYLKETRQWLVDHLSDAYNRWQQSTLTYPEKVQAAHDQWLAIGVPHSMPKSVMLQRHRDSWPTELSLWNQLKASATFYHFAKRNSQFVWKTAGRHLQWIKAHAKGRQQLPPIPMVQNMWVVMRPNKKLILRMTRPSLQGYGMARSVEAQELDLDEDENESADENEV